MAPKYRMAAVKEAPVFHPSAEEFADPLRYIASIRAEAEPCGLCRIVPPAGWAVPFNQDPATFAFKTRVQTVNELQLRLSKGKNKTFRVEYVEFMKEHENVTVTRWPVFGGKKLDLRVLYESVARHGGFDAACRAKAWAAIAAGLDAGDARAADASRLKQLYQKWLLAFETHKKQRGELTPAGKAKEAAATKKEREEERKREKASQAAVERAAAEHEPTSEKEEDLLEALIELGNVAEPPPKRLKLEMVRARRKTRDPRVFSFFFSRDPHARRLVASLASDRVAWGVWRRDRLVMVGKTHVSAARHLARDAWRVSRIPRPAPPRCGSRVRLFSIASDPFLSRLAFACPPAGPRGGGAAAGDLRVPELRRLRARGLHDPLRRMRRRVRGRPAPLGPNENRDLPRHPIRVGPGNQTDARHHAAVNRQIVSARVSIARPAFFSFSSRRRKLTETRVRPIAVPRDRSQVPHVLPRPSPGHHPRGRLVLPRLHRLGEPRGGPGVQHRQDLHGGRIRGALRRVRRALLRRGREGDA